MNHETHRRSHLTKEQRLPKSYKEAEKILKIVKRCESNVKTALNNSRLRGAVLHKVSGLTFNILRQSRVLDSIFEKTQILEKEPYLRKELAAILVHELLFGNGLYGKSKPIETVLKYQIPIEEAYSDLKSDDSLFNDLRSIPKYIRVNTLVITLPEVLEDLEYLGVTQIYYEAHTSEDEFYELVKNLEKSTFLLDYHFKDLLIFHAEENLTTWSLYQKRHVFIQDKSSYIPAYVLDPPPGSAVIDACAAPGMKTLHLSALMKNEGMIYAFERDQHRFEILNNMLKSGHANICETFCGDFHAIDPKDEKYSSVEYILLDPSCSGSGMVSRLDYITDTKESKNDLRFQKLAGFQIILLKHALLFPSVKRVVYSTCSITETENEFVVHEVLNHFSHRFKLSPVLPNWTIRGSNDFEFGSHCLRAFPDKCFTNGFFVAMFERLENSEEHYNSVKRQRKQEKKKNDSDAKQSCFNQEDSIINNEKEIMSDFNNEDQLGRNENKNTATLDNSLSTAVEEMPPMKKHKKKHKKDKLSIVDGECNEILSKKTETLDISIQNISSKPTIEEKNPGVKLHKRKHDKEYSRSINDENNLKEIRMLEPETPETNIQNIILTDRHQQTHSQHKKHKRKHEEDYHSDFNQMQMKEPQTQSIDAVSEVKPHKERKKKKHEKEYYSNIYSDTQISQNSNVSDDILIETIPEGKAPHKKKKRIRKHEEDNHSTTEINLNPMQKEPQTQSIDAVLEVKPHKERKKKKHGKEYCSYVDSGTQITQNSYVSNDTLLGTISEVKSSHKRKKHKRKHEEDNHSTTEIYLNQMQMKEPQTQSIDVVSEVKPHKEKKKRKKEYCSSINSDTQITQNSNVSDYTLTETISEVKSPHKKKHKRKHEEEDINLLETQTSEVEIQNSNNEKISTQTAQEVNPPHKSKKKHGKESCSSSFCEAQTPNVQKYNSKVENDVLAQTEDERSHKLKKKHKRKHDKDCNDNIPKTQIPDVQLHHSTVENDKLTETVQDGERLHKRKKKHKNKYETEN